MHLKSSKVELNVGVPFSCDECRYQAEVRMSTLGDATRVTGDGAAYSAMRNAVSAAHDAIAFVPCPVCGHRDKRAAAEIKWSGRFNAAGVALVVPTAVFLVLLLQGRADAFGMLGYSIIVALGAVIGLGFYTRVQRTWRKIAPTAQFTGRPAPSGPIR